jgi:TPR repeat protein
LSQRLALRAVAVAVLSIGSAAADDAPTDDDTGVLTMPDGSEISIAFANMTYTGVGRFVWRDGRSYAGDFVDGHPQGRGMEQVPDGSRYDGEWIDGLHSGLGSLTLSDSSRYDGQFENGVRSGQGLFQSAAGRYQGGWVDDVPQGDGRFDYTDGASYVGEWFSGRRNGFGAYRRADGSNYEGDWLDDMPDGYGQLVESDDYTYEGGWSKGQRAGYGAMQIGGTFGYEGTWVANMRQGFGRELRPDGGEYTGEWRDDQREGLGTLRMPSGAFHDGHWEHNSPVGQGTRVSSEGIEFVGPWDGDFVSNGHLELRGGFEYAGNFYDAKRKTVDPVFLDWLEPIAEQGNVDAALLLGQAYRFFLKPAPDRAKAILWYGRAADGGLPEAQYQLAEIMFEDSATRQRGLELLMAAAEQGHGPANTRLGVFFQLGTYVPKDHARARRFYEVATGQGDLTARNNLAWLLATSPSAQLRDGTRAVALAQPLAVLYESWGYLDTLAAAQAEAGDFAAASRTEKKALAQAEPDASADALRDLQHRLTLFQRDEPYREP